MWGRWRRVRRGAAASSPKDAAEPNRRHHLPPEAGQSRGDPPGRRIAESSRSPLAPFMGGTLMRMKHPALLLLLLLASALLALAAWAADRQPELSSAEPSHTEFSRSRWI